MHLPVTDLNCTSACYGTFTSWINAKTAGLGITVEFARRVPDWRIGAAAGTLVRVGNLPSAGWPHRRTTYGNQAR